MHSKILTILTTLTVLMSSSVIAQPPKHPGAEKAMAKIVLEKDFGDHLMFHSRQVVTMAHNDKAPGLNGLMFMRWKGGDPGTEVMASVQWFEKKKDLLAFYDQSKKREDYKLGEFDGTMVWKIGEAGYSRTDGEHFLISLGGSPAPPSEMVKAWLAIIASKVPELEKEVKETADPPTEEDLGNGYSRRGLDTTYIRSDTVGLLIAHPQRILSRKSKVKDELDQMFAKVAESEGLDVRNLRQIVAQLGPPPLSSRPIDNFFDEQLWTVTLRFDEPVDVESYIDKHARGYTKAEHKRETYYRHDSRMEMWFPDNRTLILAAERRILSFIDDSKGKGPMASRMRRADVTDDLLLEIDVRQAGPLLLESLPSEAQDPEIYPVIEETIQKLKRITLTAEQSSDTPIRAQFQAIDAEKARELDVQASVWLEAAKGRWPKLRDQIRELPADRDTSLPNRRNLALAFADEIDSALSAIRLSVDEDQLLVRLEREGGVDLAAMLVFFLLID
jgi:hypothetical protein